MIEHKLANNNESAKVPKSKKIRKIDMAYTNTIAQLVAGHPMGQTWHAACIHV